LPKLVVYYLTRWGHLNLITTFNDEFIGDFELEEDFVNSPGELLNSIHAHSVAPFSELRRENKD